MAGTESKSLTQRIGGNRTIVLVIIVLILVFFTVGTYVSPALGVGGKGGEYVRFTVNGREVVFEAAAYASDLRDWQRFHSTRMDGARPEEYLEELMTVELARDAGITVPDETVADFLKSFPPFQGNDGQFDPAAYRRVLAERFGGLTERAFEERVRFHLTADHYRKLYFHCIIPITDQQCWERWKGEHPHVGVSYAWQPVAPIRAEMKVEELKDEEIESFWKDPSVQARHKTVPKRGFEVAWVGVDGVTPEGYLAAREKWKEDADLKVTEAEALEFWNQSRQWDFDLSKQEPAVIEALRAENVKPEAPKPPEPNPPGEGKKDGEPKEEEPKDKTPPAPDEMDDMQQFHSLWRHRLEKEVFLRKLLAKVKGEAKDGGSLAESAKKWSVPGCEIQVLEQKEPIDQYAVEKLPGVGYDNSSLRYVLNDYVKPDDRGKVHAEVMPRTSQGQKLPERGWVVLKVGEVVPAAVPALAAVKEKVAGELLDERAKGKARTMLGALRKVAEEGRLSLADAVKGGKAGGPFEFADLDPFNEFTWRRPAPRDPSGDPAVPLAAAAEAWKTPARREASVKGRYFLLREVPEGGFAEIVDDVAGTGALYLLQVKSKAPPAVEEMTRSQIASERRALSQERIASSNQELSYGRLKDRLSLFVDGQPAKAEEPREATPGRRTRR